MSRVIHFFTTKQNNKLYEISSWLVEMIQFCGNRRIKYLCKKKLSSFVACACSFSLWRDCCADTQNVLQYFDFFCAFKKQKHADVEELKSDFPDGSKRAVSLVELQDNLHT